MPDTLTRSPTERVKPPSARPASWAGPRPCNEGGVCPCGARPPLPARGRAACWAKLTGGARARGDSLMILDGDGVDRADEGREVDFVGDGVLARVAAGAREGVFLGEVRTRGAAALPGLCAANFAMPRGPPLLAATALRSSSGVTVLMLANTPWPSLHTKYETPFTVPLCFPTGSSRETPHQLPCRSRAGPRDRGEQLLRPAEHVAFLPQYSECFARTGLGGGSLPPS